ncbi:MAG: DUF3465 domain-containing protein [Wenzhouxiangella sp.]
MMRRFGVVLIVVSGLLALLVACGGEEMPDNSRLVDAFADGRTGVWLSGHGTVVQAFSPSGGSQRFLVRIQENFSVMVRHNIGENGAVPAERGDTIQFQGRYEFHGGGGEILLTHADTAQPGGGGWIIHNGVRYD